MSENIVKQGYIYLVTEDVYVSLGLKEGSDHPAGARVVIIPKGELLEMRYFSPAHFRDVYNNYFAIHTDQLGKLKVVAKIMEPVKFKNRAHLHDILRLGLYEDVERQNTQELFDQRSKNIIEHFTSLQVYGTDEYAKV